jgi:hypothetical protein
MKRVISYLYLQRSNRPARGETHKHLHGMKYPDIRAHFVTGVTEK